MKQPVSPDPGEPFVPEQRDPSRLTAVDWNPLPSEVPRTAVERAIAAVLHRHACGDIDGGDPGDEVTDAEGHAEDARLICDELRERGWTVVRA